MNRFRRRLCALAGLAALAVATPAALPDVNIELERSIDSPNLVVRYQGATATLVELRLNGESLGTRTVSGASANGETTFALLAALLKEGANNLEVRLFDRSGRMVGAQKFTVQSAAGGRGPVMVAMPKAGASVRGEIEVKVDLDAQLGQSYVSFFVNENFRAMKNFPPYTFSWDTTREPNGWHQVEAWAVDSNSQTYKARKVRVFVDNPGGRTNRAGQTGDLTPARPTVAGQTAPVQPQARPVSAPGGKPVPGPRLNPIAPAVPAKAAPKVTPKAVQPSEPQATATRVMTPTGTRTVGTTPPAVVAKPKPIEITNAETETAPVALAVPSAPEPLRVSVERGLRLPNIGRYSIYLDGKPVQFDVAPRVDDGVPMSPFRHLIEEQGGEVKWDGYTKSVTGKLDQTSIFFRIGETVATVNDLEVMLERASYIDRGRSIVPLTFLQEALKLNIEFDRTTRHVLITRIK